MAIIKKQLSWLLFYNGILFAYEDFITVNLICKSNMAQKGNIGITTENIFPVIKKFLYSDHEIFLREIVSNAVDATQKLKTLASTGEFKGEMGDLSIRITIDKEAGTLTVSDRGIGMTADEIEKYINQIAFSGAGEFLEKYKDDANAIIGHFGLGFYSTFMVSKRVDIMSKSHIQDSVAVKWTCDGTPSYELSEIEKQDRGTDIVLHIDDENKEFLEKGKISSLLAKYCKFLPIPIIFGKTTEWKEGKEVETDTDNIINDTTPLWTKQPSTLSDDDYRAFYKDLYPMIETPLFWIHLNVDYPFNLTGVLYFPKIKSNLDIHRHKIQLYSNQVFVTDQVENIVPEFLTLLHGVIDSPDIPLNVSRSYLQSDANVKKISKYITKKVSDRLTQLFKQDRKAFEEKWDDLKLFIEYGMLSEEDFYDKAKDYMLLKNTEGKYFTLEEYKSLISTAQTDKDGNLIFLYTNDKIAEYSYVEAAKAKGYDVLLLDGQLDTPWLQMLEQKLEKVRFTRVDGDTLNKLILKEDTQEDTIDDNVKSALNDIFRAKSPIIEKVEFNIESTPLGENTRPIILTQSEYMRRMKEASRLQSGMSFYGEMPDMYTIVINTDHKQTKNLINKIEAELMPDITSINAELKGLEARKAIIEEKTKNKKLEDLLEEERNEIDGCKEKISEQLNKKKALFASFAHDNCIISQLLDLALLQNGLLKGEALEKFLNRSIELLD